MRAWTSQPSTGTPIHATGDGRVTFADYATNGYGTHVVVDHGFEYETLYAHLSELKVRNGQRVKRGDVIGLVGNTGLSAGPHLHYEVHKNGEAVDPANYYFNDLNAGGIRADAGPFAQRGPIVGLIGTFGALHAVQGEDVEAFVLVHRRGGRANGREHLPDPILGEGVRHDPPKAHRPWRSLYTSKDIDQLQAHPVAGEGQGLHPSRRT
jgi:hypothetical protein